MYVIKYNTICWLVSACLLSLPLITPISVLSLLHSHNPTHYDSLSNYWTCTTLHSFHTFQLLYMCHSPFLSHFPTHYVNLFHYLFIIHYMYFSYSPLSLSFPPLITHQKPNWQYIHFPLHVDLPNLLSLPLLQPNTTFFNYHYLTQAHNISPSHYRYISYS